MVRRSGSSTEPRPDAGPAGDARHPARTQASSEPSPPSAGSCRCRRNGSDAWPCRLRATELVGMLEGTSDATPEAEAARQRLADQLADVGRSAAMSSAGGARPGTRSVHLPGARPGQCGRGQPAPGGPARPALQLLPVRNLRSLPAAVRLRQRLPHPDRAESWLLRLRDGGPRGVRGVHARAARAPGPGRAGSRPGRISNGSSRANGSRRSSATGRPKPSTSARRATSSSASGTAS